MHLWNSDELAKDFANGRVSFRSRVTYFAVIIVVFGISFFAAKSNGPIEGRDARYTGIQTIACLFLGIAFCFWRNWKVDGRDFVSRLVAFSVLNLPRFILVTVIVHGLTVLVLHWFHPQGELVLGFLNSFLVLTPLAYLLFESGRGISKIKAHRLVSHG